MFVNMKVIHFLVSLIIIQVNCQFLSILQELDMRNPIIVGDIKELKMDKMYHLMKSIMNKNQNFRITSNINNRSFQESPGIILRQNVPDTFHEIPMNLHKPWVIIGKQVDRFSQINQPLYFLENRTVYEQYEFKSLKTKVRRFQKLSFLLSSGSV